MNIITKSIVFVAAYIVSMTAAAQSKSQVTGGQKNVPAQIENVRTACQLATYGYQTKSAMSLILAAQMLGSLTVEGDTLTMMKEGGQTVSGDNGTKPVVVSFDVEQMMKDARVYANGNKHLLSLLDDMQKTTRGSVPGPDASRRFISSVKAHHTDTWTFRLRGGSYAYVAVSGDGDTDLDVEVYDYDDKLIADDSGCDDSGIIRFFVRWSGDYKIKIINLGNVYNRYIMVVDQNN